MAALAEGLRWIVYVLIAGVAISLVAVSGVAILVIGAIVGTLGFIALIVWFVAALVKEHWESTKASK